MKQWNKRKLPAKYYRSCAVDLNETETESSPVSRYKIVKNSATPSAIMDVPSQADVSLNLGDPFAVDSHFSTFGKHQDVANLKPYVPGSEVLILSLIEWI